MIDEPKHRYVSKSVSDTSDFISTNLLKCEINASDNESLSSNLMPPVIILDSLNKLPLKKKHDGFENKYSPAKNKKKTFNYFYRH